MHEDLFQIRLRHRKIRNISCCQHLQQRLHLTVIQEAHYSLCFLPVPYPGQSLQLCTAVDVHPSGIRLGERFHTVAGNDPSCPDDGSAVTVTLNLLQDMTGQEYGRTFLIPLPQDLKERLLHQRVKTAGRFIQDQQLRLML